MSNVIYVTIEYNGDHEQAINFISDKDFVFDEIKQKDKNMLLLKISNTSFDEIRFFKDVAYDEKTGATFGDIKEVDASFVGKCQKEYEAIEAEEKRQKEVERVKKELAEREEQNRLLEQEEANMKSLKGNVEDEQIKEILDKVELPPKAELEKNDPIFVILNKQFLSKFIIGGTLAAIVLSWFN